MKKKKLCFSLYIFFFIFVYPYSVNSKSALELYNSALKIEDSGKSEQLLKIIASDYPESPFAQKSLFRLGEINFLKKNYSAASEYFEKIIKLYNNSDLYKDSLYKYAVSKYLDGKTFEAENILKEYLRTYPDDSRKQEIFIKIADIYFNNGEIAEAINQYTNSLSIFNTNDYKSWAYFQLGNCYNYANQLNEAFVAYMTVIKFYQNSMEYYKSLEMIDQLKQKKINIDYKVIQDNNPAYKFYIQLGAFKSKENAEKLVDTFKNDKDHKQKIIKISLEDNFYKVRLGNFFSFEEANKYKRDYSLGGFILTEN
ncbi:tetratricopeptide repeat protein [Candidatus Dependentiae bacterium]|nr:tetratricopeptide repeat protein [Candidatus Dependentiae bacterium]